MNIECALMDFVGGESFLANPPPCTKLNYVIKRRASV